MKDGLGNELKAGDLVTAQLPSANIVCRIAHIQKEFIQLTVQFGPDTDGSFGPVLALKEPTSIIQRPN